MKALQQAQAAFLMLCFMMVGVANAAVPVGVDTAITTASTDAVTVGGYVIIALAAILPIYWIMKFVRR